MGKLQPTYNFNCNMQQLTKNFCRYLITDCICLTKNTRRPSIGFKFESFMKCESNVQIRKTDLRSTMLPKKSSNFAISIAETYHHKLIISSANFRNEKQDAILPPFLFCRTRSLVTAIRSLICVKRFS